MSLLDKLKAVLAGESNRESASSNAASSTAGGTTSANTNAESALKDPVDQTPSGSTAEGSIDDAETEESGIETGDETPDSAEAITADEDDTPAVNPENGSSGAAVSEISGIGPAYSDRLLSIGIETVDELAAAEPDDIASQTDISIGRVSNWVERARNF